MNEYDQFSTVPLSGPLSLDTMQQNAAESSLKSRRSHRKSRLGCGECKRRHIKVSETRFPFPFFGSRLLLDDTTTMIIFYTFSMRLQSECIMLGTLSPLTCLRRWKQLLPYSVTERGTDSEQCDEKKPRCNNCANHAIECTFSATAVCKSRPPAVSESGSSVKAGLQRYQFRPCLHLSEGSRRTAKSSQAEDRRAVNKSTGTQCDLSASLNSRGISFADLYLFHHYTIVAYKTIVDEVDGYDIWQNHVAKWSIAFPSILHLVLALSALHLSYERPEQREEYVQQADDHFTFGVRSVTAILSQLDEDSCQKVYISAVLICFVYFGRGPRYGEYLVFSNSGPAEWLVLMNGVKVILESYQEKVFSGILQPKGGSHVHSISPSLQGELDEYAVHIQAVQRLVEETSDEVDCAMYVVAINDLLGTVNEVYEKRSAQKPSVGLMQVLMRWLYRLPRKMVSLMEQKEPPALILLAYWAVLLKYMRSVWLMKEWDEHVLSGIRASLHPNFHQWIEWPLRQLR